MSDAVEIKERPLPLQPDFDDTGPLAAFQEARHGATQQLRALPGALLQEISDGPADKLLERRADKIGKTAVDGANLAVEREGQQDVVERVDQVAIALLRPGDDFEQLFELFVAGSGLVVLLKATHQAAHFGEFLVLLPRVYAEENDEDNEEDGQFLEAVRQSADGVPGRPSISQGQEKQNNASEPPEFALAFLELLEARRDDRTSAGSGRSVSSGAARVLVFVLHKGRRDPVVPGVIHQKVSYPLL